MNGALRAAWAYRQFIIRSIYNEFRLRVIRSRLGGAWIILQPLALVLMYALVLSTVIAGKLPGIDSRFAYAIYLTAGIVAWSLFLEVTNRCVGLFVERAELIKKLRFPRITLPLIVLGVATLNNLLLMAVVVIVFAILGHLAGVAMLWLPLIMLLTALFAAGLGLSLGVLNVFIRDIGQLMPIVTQFLFLATPIIYPVHIVPEPIRSLLVLNPLYHLVGAYHDILVYSQAPHVSVGLLVVMLLTGVLLFLALQLFRRGGPHMVDVL